MERYAIKWMERIFLADENNYFYTDYCPACNSFSYPYFKVEKFQYLLCHNCQTIFEKQRPTDRGAEILYNSIFIEYWRDKIEIPRYFRNAKEKYSMPKNILDKLKKQLFAYLSADDHILLDYASGLGVVADYYYQTNRFDDVYIYEINQYSLDFIYKHFIKIKKLNNKIQADVVILYAALEHFSEPYKILNEVCKTLKEGGLLQVYIPYIGPLTRKYFPQMYQMLNSGSHVNFFSYKGIIELSRRLNLKVLNTIYLGSNRNYLYHFLNSRNGYQTYKFIYDDKEKIEKIISGYFVNKEFYDNSNYGNYFIRNIAKIFNKIGLNNIFKIIDKGSCMSIILKKRSNYG